MKEIDNMFMIFQYVGVNTHDHKRCDTDTYINS